MQTAIQDPADKDSSVSSVLFHIKWDDLFNYHKVTNLQTEFYDESEVILNDGSKFVVESVNENANTHDD